MPCPDADVILVIARVLPAFVLTLVDTGIFYTARHSTPTTLLMAPLALVSNPKPGTSFATARPQFLSTVRISARSSEELQSAKVGAALSRCGS